MKTWRERNRQPNTECMTAKPINTHESDEGKGNTRGTQLGRNKHNDKTAGSNLNTEHEMRDCQNKTGNTQTKTHRPDMAIEK